jgi:hypothetical protein
LFTVKKPTELVEGKSEAKRILGKEFTPDYVMVNSATNTAAENSAL